MASFEEMASKKGLSAPTPAKSARSPKTTSSRSTRKRPWFQEEDEIELSNDRTSESSQAEARAQKPVNNEGTTGKQPVNNRYTNEGTTGKQLENSKSLKGKQPVNNRYTNEGTASTASSKQPVDNRGTSSKQPVDNQGTNLSFSSLLGLQRSIVLLVFESSRISRSRTSLPISLKHIAESCKTTEASAKTTIARLKKKGVLLTTERKACRGGWAKYEISERLYQELLNFQPVNNQRTTGEQPVNNQRTTGEQPVNNRYTNEGTNEGTTSPSSSRYKDKYINYKSTTTECGRSDAPPSDEDHLPPEWKKVDYSPLNDLEIKFGPRQLLQAMSFGATPDALQESIYHFAWAMKQGWQPEGGLRSSPLNYFMGCIRSNGVFEHGGYQSQKKKRRALELQWLAEQDAEDKEEERRLLLSKAKFFWQKRKDDGDFRLEPIALGLGEKVPLGSDRHIETLAQSFQAEIERVFSESFEKSQELQ